MSPETKSAPAQSQSASQPSTTNSLAVIGFVLSLIGFGVVSVIMGAIALSQIKKSNQKGRGLAIAAIIIGILTTTIVIVSFSSRGGSSKPAASTPASNTATQEDASKPLEEPKKEAPAAPIPTVTAQKLVADYDANQLSADKTYKDKVYKITGSINDFGSDIVGEPYVTLVGDGYFNNVNCSFSNEQADAISKLKKGQAVTFQGTVYGDLIGSVSVHDCSIVK
jgi:hypothetical protein